MKSATEKQTVAEKVVQEIGEAGSNEGVIGNARAAHQVHFDTTAVKEFNSDTNTMWSSSSAWAKTKVLTNNLGDKIVQTVGSTLGTVAYCVKPPGKEEVVKKGKIAVIIESDGTQSTEEVVWKETHHKDGHSGLHVVNNDVARRHLRSNTTQPASNKNGSTG